MNSPFFQENIVKRFQAGVSKALQLQKPHGQPAKNLRAVLQFHRSLWAFLKWKIIQRGCPNWVQRHWLSNLPSNKPISLLALFFLCHSFRVAFNPYQSQFNDFLLHHPLSWAPGMSRKGNFNGEASPWLGPKEATKPEGHLPTMYILGRGPLWGTPPGAGVSDQSWWGQLLAAKPSWKGVRSHSCSSIV